MPAASGWRWNMPSSPPSDHKFDARLRLIVDSYRRLTGKVLVAPASGDADAVRQALWQASFAVVAHGTEDDPIFFYGNRYALRCFEMSEAEFVTMPSRLSAEPVAREARARLLEQVARKGYVDDYSGMRIASSGRRFMINGTVWNLVDETGICHGQAAAFTAQD